MREQFEAFWQAYPSRNGLKAGKGLASVTWQKKNLDAKALEIMLALSVQVEHKKKCDAARVFCAEFPDAVRWLRHERWKDEVSRETRHPMLANTEPQDERQAASLARRRELRDQVAREHPEWDNRTVLTESGKLWKAEGWENL